MGRRPDSTAAARPPCVRGPRACAAPHGDGPGHGPHHVVAVDRAHHPRADVLDERGVDAEDRARGDPQVAQAQLGGGRQHGADDAVAVAQVVVEGQCHAVPDRDPLEGRAQVGQQLGLARSRGPHARRVPRSGGGRPRPRRRARRGRSRRWRRAAGARRPSRRPRRTQPNGLATMKTVARPGPAQPSATRSSRRRDSASPSA